MTRAQALTEPNLSANSRASRNLITGFAASVALVAAAFLPYCYGITVWFALVPALLVSRSVGLKRLFLVAWAVGYLNCLIIYYWLMIVSVPGGLLLPILLGIYWPVFFVLVEILARRFRVPRVLSVITLWPLLEFVRGWAFTGLPWFYLGHALYRWPRLIQSADLGGVLLVSVVIATVNGLLAEGLMRPSTRGRRMAALAAAVLVFTANLAYGAWRFASVVETPGPIVALVQPNVPQSLKISQSEKESTRIFHDLRSLTLSDATKPAEAIFWPETIMPGIVGVDDYTVANGMEAGDILDELAERGIMSPAQREEILRETVAVPKASAAEANFADIITRVCGANLSNCLKTYDLMAVTAKLAGKPLVAGCIPANLDGEHDLTGTYNRATQFDASGREVAFYDKVHLVPFGEFIPFRESCPPVSHVIAAMMPVQPLTIAGPDFTVLDVGKYRYGPAICFEDTFSYIGRAYRAKGAQILLNITNDGWFGHSFELEAHLANSLFRAVETRMAVIRAANTGVSAVISPRGIVTSRLVDSSGRDREIKGVLVAGVPVSPDQTLYLTIGDWWLLALACLPLLWALLASLKRR